MGDTGDQPELINADIDEITGFSHLNINSRGFLPQGRGKVSALECHRRFNYPRTIKPRRINGWNFVVVKKNSPRWESRFPWLYEASMFHRVENVDVIELGFPFPRIFTRSSSVTRDLLAHGENVYRYGYHEIFFWNELLRALSFFSRD